ncbi:hypothetical protein PP707_06825 [Acetobacter pasteurianus]|nr:hypothetical protein [Acetobacter pasteurianus]
MCILAVLAELAELAYLIIDEDWHNSSLFSLLCSSLFLVSVDARLLPSPQN